MPKNAEPASSQELRDTISTIIRDRGMSEAEASRRLGYSAPSQLNVRLNSGKPAFTREEIERICTLFQLDQPQRVELLRLRGDVVIIQPDQSLQVVAVDELGAALVPLLSEVLRVELRTLPDMVAALVRGTLSQDDLRAQLPTSPLVNFTHSQLGNVTIGDIAGRDVITIGEVRLVLPPAPPPDPPFALVPGLYPPCPQRVGHTAIAADLETRLQAAATRRTASIVLLESPPGYGKHALVQELAATCVARGGLVIGVDFNRPPPDGADPALPALVAVPAAFREQTAKDYPYGATVGPHWCHLAAQAKLALQRSLSPGRIGLDRPETLFRDLLRPVAYNRLVVVLLEHWEHAGPQWETLLGELMGQIQHNPMRLVVVLTRDGDGAAPLTSTSSTETVPQHLLRRVSAADLAAALGPAHRDLSKRLYAMSRGHPALALTFWKQWRAVEAVTQDAEGVWQATDADNLWVTGAVRDFATDLLTQRLGPTPPLPVATVRRLLAVAALEGPVFTAAAVAAAAGVDYDTFLAVCDDYLWHEDPEAGVLLDAEPVAQPAYTEQAALVRYRFALPYLQLVFARELPHAEQTTLALALAVALERHYQPEPERIAGVLATLFKQGDDPRAKDYRTRHERNLGERVNEMGLRWTITTLTAQGHAETWQMYEARMALSNWLYEHGRYAEAMPEAKAAFVFAEGCGDQERIARALNLKGLLLHAMGDTAAARPLIERALAITEAVLGPLHPATAGSLNNLGLLLQAMGDTAAARPLIERALAIREAVLGPLHPATATSLNNLAALLYAMGDYAAARPLYERALAISEAVLGPLHPYTQGTRRNLAALDAAEGRE